MLEAEGSKLIEDVGRTGIGRVDERHVACSTRPATVHPTPPVGGWPTTDATGRQPAAQIVVSTHLDYSLGNCATIIFDTSRAGGIGGSDRSTSFHSEFLAIGGDLFLRPIACDRRDPGSDSQPRPHHCDARARR